MNKDQDPYDDISANNTWEVWQALRDMQGDIMAMQNNRNEQVLMSKKLAELTTEVKTKTTSPADFTQLNKGLTLLETRYATLMLVLEELQKKVDGLVKDQSGDSVGEIALRLTRLETRVEDTELSVKLLDKD